MDSKKDCSISVDVLEYFSPEIIALELFDHPNALSPNKKGNTEIPCAPGSNLNSWLFKFSDLGSLKFLLAQLIRFPPSEKDPPSNVKLSENGTN